MTAPSLFPSFYKKELDVFLKIYIWFVGDDRYPNYGGDMSPYTPPCYNFTPTPHTNGSAPGGGGGGGSGGGGGGGSMSGGYDISGTTDYVDSTTFDPRQTPIEPLPDSNLVSPVVSTGIQHFFFFFSIFTFAFTNSQNIVDLLDTLIISLQKPINELASSLGGSRNPSGCCRDEIFFQQREKKKRFLVSNYSFFFLLPKSFGGSKLKSECYTY